MAKYQGPNEPSNSEIQQMLMQMMTELTKPKKVVRDEQGRIAGVMHGEDPTQPTEGM
jgi:hypothetical protein